MRLTENKRLVGSLKEVVKVHSFLYHCYIVVTSDLSQIFILNIQPGCHLLGVMALNNGSLFRERDKLGF